MKFEGDVESTRGFVGAPDARRQTQGHYCTCHIPFVFPCSTCTPSSSSSSSAIGDGHLNPQLGGCHEAGREFRVGGRPPQLGVDRGLLPLARSGFSRLSRGDNPAECGLVSVRTACRHTVQSRRGAVFVHTDRAQNAAQKRLQLQTSESALPRGSNTSPATDKRVSTSTPLKHVSSYRQASQHFHPS